MALPRDRTLPLLAVLVVGAAGGVLLAARGGGEAPAPCPAPAVEGAWLRCDGAGAAPGARAWLAGARLDVNGASRRELEALPGVGPGLAQRIVDGRTARGRFDRVEDLLDVKGIGPKTLERLRPWLTVEGAP